jgi:hypothetical protein
LSSVLRRYLHAERRPSGKKSTAGDIPSLAALFFPLFYLEADENVAQL